MIKTLGIDCDGVLRNFTGKLIEVYHRELPLSFYPKSDDDIKVFDLKYSFGIMTDIYDFAFKKHSKEIYTETNMYDGTKEFLQKLKDLKYTLFLTTNQPNDLCREYTLYWLIKNDLKKYFDEYEFLSNKAESETDLLLDDYTKNLQEFKKISVCFDRPWNKDYFGYRAFDYDDFVYKLEKGFFK